MNREAKTNLSKSILHFKMAIKTNETTERQKRTSQSILHFKMAIKTK